MSGGPSGHCEICLSWRQLLETCQRCGQLVGPCCMTLGTRLCLHCYYEEWQALEAVVWEEARR